MAVTYNLFIGIGGWASGTYVLGNMRSNAGNGYMCVIPGSSTAAPTGTGAGLINNGGTAWWVFCAAIDYSDLPTAQGALPSTFTQPITWQFWNCGAITTPLGTQYLSLTSGNVTTSTNNLTLTAAPGQGIRDALRRGITPLAIGTPAAGVGFLLPSGVGNTSYINIDIANVIIDGLQFQDPSSNSGSSIIISGTGLTVRNCILDGYGQVGSPAFYSSATGTLMTNNLLIDRQASGVNADFVNFDAGATATFVNNGVVAVNAPGGTAVAVQSNSTSTGAIIVRNSYFFGYGMPLEDQNIAGSIVVDHCCSDVAAFTDSTDNGNEKFSKSAINQFVSSTSDFRVKVSADILNAGVADTTDIPSADDIARTHRPQGSAWDIGPWERPAPSAFRRSPLRVRL